MSDETHRYDEDSKIDAAPDQPDRTDKTGQTGQKVLRIAAAICIGLAQGIAVFFMMKASPEWRWYITVSLAPLPVYLARDFLTVLTKRAAVPLILWTAILILLDAGHIFFREPHTYWSGTEMRITMMAYAGALMTLPNFVSWIDGGGALPEWRTSFGIFSRMFFAGAIAGFFTLLFFAVFGLGAGLARMIGGPFAVAARWVVLNFEVVAFAAWGAAFCRTANAAKLIDVLERYVLAVFSCIAPLVSLFTVLFIAALPMGIDRLWRRGLNSGITISFILAAGLCSFAAWQGGVTESGDARRPFVRPLDAFVKAMLVPLPIFCPILVYTIGLRIGQYSLTVDRAAAITLTAAFGLWSLAWAFFLVKRWGRWPIFYGRTNRIAFPVLGVALILLSSPVYDIRRIVLHERFEWLKESIRDGADVDGFDWRYTARGLGSYGVRAIEELDDGGLEAISARFGPFASAEQAEEIRKKIADERESARSAYKLFGGDHGLTYEERKKIALENLAQSIPDAPVFGGSLSPEETERLALEARTGFESSALMPPMMSAADNPSSLGAEFLYLTDLNGDGERDILIGIGDNIYLLRPGRAFLLEKRMLRYNSGTEADNKTAISEDRQRMIRNQWNILQIDDTIFFVGPRDAYDIISGDEGG